MEYETTHNHAMSALYKESEVELEGVQNEQEFLLAKLDNIQKKLKKELRPYMISNSRENQLFQLVLGDNNMLVKDLPPKLVLPG